MPSMTKYRLKLDKCIATCSLFIKLFWMVKGDFHVALQLSSELDNLFVRGNNDERRLLCETIFKRVYVHNGKIVTTELNSPFALIAGSAKGSETILTRQPLCSHHELPFRLKSHIH
jgi:hypothetical protein